MNFPMKIEKYSNYPQKHLKTKKLPLSVKVFFFLERKNQSNSICRNKERKKTLFFIQNPPIQFHLLAFKALGKKRNKKKISPK